MQTFIFATSNKNKLKEVKNIVGSKYHIKTPDDIGFHENIDEPYETFRENAKQKTKTIVDFAHGKESVFSEDTGLEVHSLNLQPGVRSARFASNECDWRANVRKVLTMMEAKQNRKARFITVYCLFYKNNYYYFEGFIHGIITNSMQGANGFGYDSIFIPDGEKKTFAEMSLEEKNTFSHRKKGLVKMLNFLDKKS